MAGKDVGAASAALTADGTADGYITVADNTPFYKGADCFLAKAGSQVEVIITEIAAAGKIGLQLKRAYGVLNSPNYGRSDMSAYTLAAGWSIFQPSQFIYNAT